MPNPPAITIDTITDTIADARVGAASIARPASVLIGGQGDRWIDDWRPEDVQFWTDGGERIARRNLVFSVLTEHIGFSIWSMWSVIILFLGKNYGFDPAHKFLLTTMPVAVGSVLRIPYTFAVARFGGRNWTIFSTAILVVPCALTALVLKPGVSFNTLLAVAAVAGVGGGNFSSSMANIDAFYPQRLKGWALGLNAGGGNIGVAAVQLVGLAVLAVFGASHPRVILAIYVPLILLATIGAARSMDNLRSVTNDKGAMREVLHERHSWIIMLLYVGTFGSFIGFSFAFGQVLQVQFASTFDTPVKAASVTFLGPLIGSLIRPVGGRLADAIVGSFVTFWTFVAMACAATVVITASQLDSLPLFIVGFILLFVLSGLGNGSTYKMIPAMFTSHAQLAVARGVPADEATRRAKRMSRALIGLAGAVGAFGGVLVNLSFREAFLTAKTGDAAYAVFIGLYVLCAAVTWLVYRRNRPGRLAGV